MKKTPLVRTAAALCGCVCLASSLFAQVGQRSPSEKKIIIDPVTGTPLTFLTSAPFGDSKIYQTHPDWTSDGQWVIFRSNRAPGQVMAVNEASGDIVQVTGKGYMGMLCVARHSMNLYLMRNMGAPEGPGSEAKKKGVGFRPRGPHEIVEVHLDKIFADSAAGTMGPADSYERVCGVIPDGINAGGNMGLDADEDYVYFSYTGDDVGKNVDVNNPAYSQYIEPGTNRAKPYGPRGMGAGPAGLASMNLKTGEVKPIVAVPFQIGHVQTNPWVHGEIVFCWETGGKAPQRTWTIMADGTGLRPLYPEPDFDWVTHEAVITKNEVAIAIEANTQGRHPNMPPDTPWGPLSATGEHPSGVGVVNLRTREMRIVGQLPFGNPGVTIWHVNGSADGRWAAADDHLYRLWVIDRHNGELLMLADMGHKTTAADHIHPTFSADGTKLEIESAMISPNGQAMNIVVVPMPRSWIARNYGDRAPE